MCPFTLCLVFLLQKRGVCALAGMGGSNGGEGSKSVSAQILIYEDYEKVEKPGSKPKNTIRLDGAKIESSYSSPNASNTSSPAYSSAVTTPQGGLRLSASPSPSSASNLQNGPVAEFYPFTVATSTGEVHEFRVEMENDRLRWVKILQLLVMYPFSPIPEEPSSNPIKDSFRQSLEAKQYGAGNSDVTGPIRGCDYNGNENTYFTLLMSLVFDTYAVSIFFPYSFNSQITSAKGVLS